MGGAVNTDDIESSSGNKDRYIFFGINSVVLRGWSIIGHNLAGHRDNLRTETNNLYGQRKICGGKTNLCGHKENLRAKNQSRWSQRQSAGRKPISLVSERQFAGRKTNLAGQRENLRGKNLSLWSPIQFAGNNQSRWAQGIGTENWLVTE